MTIKLIATSLGLALALAMGACSKPADPAAAARPGGPSAGRGGAPKAPADPMAGAKTYKCEDGSELHVVFNKEKTAATVRLDDEGAVFLPREQKSDLEAYSDGARTLGVSSAGDFAYTEAPAPPVVCRVPAEDQGKEARKEDSKVKETSAPSGATSGATPVAAPGAASGNLPAPRVAGVARTLTAADKGKTVDMKVGETIAISLVGIPTAGYVWAAETTPPFLKVTDGPSGPTIAAQNQPGYTGGNHWEVLVVEAVKAGEGELVLAMRRPWEKKAEPDAETFSVRLKVK